MNRIIIKTMLVAPNKDKLLFSRGYDDVEKEKLSIYPLFNYFS